MYRSFSSAGLLGGLLVVGGLTSGQGLPPSSIATGVQAHKIHASAIGFPDAFQVGYASNLDAGDSVILFSNSGASSTISFPVQDGNVCVNVYAFSADEQLISCCSCAVTPGGLASLSVRDDLISNTLTPGVPTSIVVKLLATGNTAAKSCNAATVGIAPNALAPGVTATVVTVHPVPPVPSGGVIRESVGAELSDSDTYGITAAPFIVGTLSAAELERVTTLCAFTQSSGGGYGICRACRLGGLGGARR